jgi:hypothetical protein
MLAAIGLFLGAILRRKEVRIVIDIVFVVKCLQVIVVSLCSATIAIVIAWFSFAVNYPLAVALDDSCVTLQSVLSNTVIQLNGIQFLIGCLPPGMLGVLCCFFCFFFFFETLSLALFVDLNGNATQAAVLLAQQLQNAEINANNNNPSNFNPISISSAAHQNLTMVALSSLMNSSLLATVTAVQKSVKTFCSDVFDEATSAPCSSSCVPSSFFSTLADYRNLSLAVAALVTLQVNFPLLEFPFVLFSFFFVRTVLTFSAFSMYVSSCLLALFSR